MRELISLIADVIGILGAFFALFAWLQARQLKKFQEQETLRQNQKIQVALSYGGKKIELPVELRRAEFSRAEILGRIGMIPLKEKERFSLKYLNTAEFLKQVTQIIEGNGESVLVIACTEDEFNQFDLSQIE